MSVYASGSGKTLFEMTRPISYSLPQNDTLDTREYPIGMTIVGAGTSTFVGVTASVISQMSVSMTLPKVLVPPPHVRSIPQGYTNYYRRL